VKPESEVKMQELKLFLGAPPYMRAEPVLLSFLTPDTFESAVLAGAHLLQDHEDDLGLHRIHAAADCLDANLADGKGQEQHKAPDELWGFGTLRDAADKI